MRAFPRRLVPRTLRGRLSLVASTTAALLMTILTVVFNVAVNRHLRHQADDELRNRAAAVATTVDTGGPRTRVLKTANDHLLDTNVWIYAHGRLLEKPPPTAGSPPAQAAYRLATRPGQGCATIKGHEPVRLCSLAVPGAQGATIVTALDLSPYRSSADTLLLGSLVLDGVMLMCTYVLTRLSVGRALRPVRTMTDQATQWSAVGSDDRFDTEGHPVELARLGTSLDVLLDRIRTVLRHERQLTGELSHELRTPLTRIVMELDWLRSRHRSADEVHAAHEVIAEAAQSMRTICDTLLDDTREGTLKPMTAPGTADIEPVLHGLLQHLDPPERVKVTVDSAAAVLCAGVAPALLERIVSPLLANAVRYARSSIILSAWHTQGTVHIHVDDDGPGVPESFVGELFQPGRRADAGDGHDGAGLGLPLARRLARAVGGEVSYDPEHTPGARFTVTLPAG
ncbi:HAMP domain-containing sensor histidine kinase [Streptomyces sp. NPDC040750]|uniref:sensor histidine kinase n=1 Tax=Streptomyces sp. NPDC040750 TaxID=3154491 RepID=UPI0033E4306B